MQVMPAVTTPWVVVQNSLRHGQQAFAPKQHVNALSSQIVVSGTTAEQTAAPRRVLPLLAAGSLATFFAARHAARRERHASVNRRMPRRAAVPIADAPTHVNAQELVLTKEAPENLREWRLQAKEKLEALGGPWPAPKNDRLLRAARGEPVDRPPKWMMRQAGRYLPEFKALMSKSDFFTVCKTPALAAELTLQPYRRMPTLDSLIIFSDILVIPVAMGMPCGMVAGVGPRFEFSLESPEDMERLNLTPNVEETLGYVYDAIFWTRQRVGNEVPVIGFSGAPWTLMGYMVQGGAAHNFDAAKKWIYRYPDESRKLLAALRDIIIDYLVGQYDAGAPLLTIFDTNCGELPPAVYEDFCVSDLKHIATEVKRQRPHALMTVFPKDGEIGVFEDSAFDVVGCSWRISPQQARAKCPSKTLQGNLDPLQLFAKPDDIKKAVRRMVEGFGVDKYIVNLGHGMMPGHVPEGAKAFVDGVDACTHEVIGGGAANKAVAPFVQTAAFTLHLQEATTCTIPFTQPAAQDLNQAIANFVTMFKKKMAASKVQRWDDFEFRWSQGDTKFEVMCNPNAFATIFDVKMFVAAKAGPQMKLSSEMPLSSLQADIDAFLA